MAGNDSNKGNPAQHRMGNPKRKERRTRSHLNGAERKRLRIADQNQRMHENLRRRANGEPTPWEAAKAARKARRTAVKMTGGLLPQPRNSDGLIVYRDADGSTKVKECCAKCTKAARLSLQAKAQEKEARALEKASARKAAATSKREDAKPVGKHADSRKRAPRQITAEGDVL